MEKEEENSKDDWKICDVKNCNNKIPPGKEIKIDNKIYCPLCGTIIIKSTMGL